MSRDGDDKLEFLEWCRMAAQLGERHAKASGSEAELRLQLVELVRLVEQADDFVEDAYKQLTEAELNAVADEALARVLCGDCGWRFHENRDTAIMLVVGGQVRALDEALATLADPVVPLDLESRWRVPGKRSVFLIPRAGPRWVPRGAPDGLERLPFSRRGLLRHRLLPTELGGRRVRLIRERSGTCEPRPVETLAVGAGLFKALKLLTQNDEATRTFRVTDLDCKEHAATLQAQLDQAHKERCFVAVWPELTLPPDARAALQDELARRQLDGDWTIPLVVAGSWHEPDANGRLANIARILDGFGKELIAYHKRRRFNAGGFLEGIEPGNELPVLILDDLAIGFALCLDFCANNSPFPKLDVDLMFVPSFGDEPTIAGHRTTASRMRIDFATRTLVAQQAKTVVPRRRGFILPPTAELDKATPESCASNEAWTTFGPTSGALRDK